MKVESVIAAVLLTGCFARAQSAPQKQAGPGRIETKTRLVSIFSDLNQRLFQAAQKHDSSAIEQFLGEDFEFRTADTPTSPKSREQWTEELSRRGLASFQVSQMAVRALHDDTAIVSFVLREKAANPAGTRHYFAVEAWTSDGDKWTCQEAYFSPVNATPSVGTQKDRKPSGKE